MTLLYNEPPVAVSPTLATALGLPAAAFLQQLHYWLEEKKANPEKYADSFANGHAWVYDSAEKWVAKMPYLGSVPTFKRMLADLRELGILVVERHNKKGFDKTSWYRINKDQLDLIVRIKMSPSSDQNDTTVVSKRSDAAYQNDPTNTKDSPKTTAETTTDIVCRNEAPGTLPGLGISADASSTKRKKKEPAPPHDPEGFVEVCRHYPNIGTRAQALEKWNQMKPQLADVLHDIAWRKQNDRLWLPNRDGETFPQLLKTYLHNRRWEEERPAITHKPGQPPPIPRYASASERMQADLDTLMNA